MFKVKIYTIGRVKETWLLEALLEYEKRLKGRAEIEWVLCKSDPELIEKISKESHWIALDPRGDLLDSPSLSRKLLQKPRIILLIGGSDGIPQQLLDKSAWRWSLSPLTFTHQMTRLILLEQLYRAFEIDSGSSYHK